MLLLFQNKSKNLIDSVVMLNQINRLLDNTFSWKLVTCPYKSKPYQSLDSKILINQKTRWNLQSIHILIEQLLYQNIFKKPYFSSIESLSHNI